MSMGVNFADLNNSQVEAVNRTSGSTIVMAGFGTGKTRVITNRVANLIDNGVKPDKIMVATFTKKASNELKERVRGLIGSDSQQLVCGTLHSICLKILRDIEGSKFSVISDDKARDIISEILQRMELDVQSKDALLDISWAKAWMLRPEDVFKHVKTRFELDMAKVYQEYDKFLKAHDLIDFDDIIYKVVMLAKDPKHATYFKDLFDCVLVDEYQDTNLLQNMMLRYINGHNNMFVVGDMQQSLYSFMGSNPEGFLSFPSHYPDCKVLSLDTNYRSTSRIIESSYHLINHNRRGMKVMLKPAGQSVGDNIKVVFTGTPEDQAQQIVSIVKSLNGTTGILCRANWQTSVIHDTLKAAGIKAKAFAESREAENPEEKDDKVFLMTIHASKGLEFDNVIVPDMEEGILPYIYSQDIEEERRIFYVAITRAKKKVFLLACELRGKHIVKPSRFLSELPRKFLSIN